MDHRGGHGGRGGQSHKNLGVLRALCGGAFLGVLALFLSSCSSNSSTPTTPTTATLDVTGKWVGPVSFEDIDANMTWQLTQTGTNVTGPVTLGMSSGTILLNGFLTGTLNNATSTSASLDYTVTVAAGGIPTQPSCAGQLKGTMTASPTTLVGPLGLTSTTCTVRITSSNITLTKQ